MIPESTRTRTESWLRPIVLLQLRVAQEALLRARAHGGQAQRRVAADEQEALVEVAHERVHFGARARRVRRAWGEAGDWRGRSTRPAAHLSKDPDEENLDYDARTQHFPSRPPRALPD